MYLFFYLFTHSFSSYSIWLDSKMRLNHDPMLIIEYFLWRTRSEYAISNHYDRHCVWEEVLQYMHLNKYNQTAIDEQFNFFQSDGLSKFDPSDLNTRLPSCMCLGVYSCFQDWVSLYYTASSIHFFFLLKFNPDAGSYALQVIICST